VRRVLEKLMNLGENQPRSATICKELRDASRGDANTDGAVRRTAPA
jgi:hypothetical protein